jgi:hypothetical protein
VRIFILFLLFSHTNPRKIITENVSAPDFTVSALRVVVGNTVSNIEPSREFLGVSNDRHSVLEDLTDAS